MPIRPELRKFYRGPEYDAQRARIVKRAGDKCEQCRVPNGKDVQRGPGGVYRHVDARCGAPWRNAKGNVTTFEPRQDLTRRVRIVLTMAHLDHNPANSDPSNLKALCTPCHLRHDAPVHGKHAAPTHYARRDRLNLKRGP